MHALVATDAIALLREGVSAVLSSDWSQLDGVTAMTVLEELEVERRRLDAAGIRVETAVESARIGGEFADTSLTDLLYNRLRVDPREARQRARRREDLGPRRTLIGEPLPPLLPLTAAALEAEWRIEAWPSRSSAS